MALPKVNLPDGHTSVEEYLAHLSANMQSTDPFIESEHTSGTLEGVEVHDASVNNVTEGDADVVADEADVVADAPTEGGKADAPDEADVVANAPTEGGKADAPAEVYERDLPRSNNKRDIDFTKVPVGSRVHVFANRYSGQYHYTRGETYEGTLINKKTAQREARTKMRDGCKTAVPVKREDLELLTELKSLRRMRTRTANADILEALAEGHARALESYKDQQLLDNDRVKSSHEKLFKVAEFNQGLCDDQTDAIKNARHNVLKPSVGKKKKRSTHNNTPF